MDWRKFIFITFFCLSFFLKKIILYNIDNFIESAGVSVLNLKNHKSLKYLFETKNNLFRLKGNTYTAGRNLTSGEIISQDLKLDLLFI